MEPLHVQARQLEEETEQWIKGFVQVKGAVPFLRICSLIPLYLPPFIPQKAKEIEKYCAGIHREVKSHMGDYRHQQITMSPQKLISYCLRYFIRVR